jgi:ATP-dependent helicase YprA (DUF1998 family)
MSLNPLKTSMNLEQRFKSYIKTTYFIQDDSIREKFEDALNKKEISKGPILEVTPPFRKGCSLDSLIGEGILSTEFRNLQKEAFPRVLYAHQEIAIRRLVTEKRNLIVATGTGSGKTEIYLITILNALMREKEAGTLTPGVRALFLYPMNALVNDQLKRMRELLVSYPSITFGRYTGETVEEQVKAEQLYLEENREKPLNNELISREIMRKSPPHILLTNYAMLEYLLLRPSDMDLFEGEYAGNWSFIVLDEIHTYTGAKGIEIAMLLRRLKNRVLGGKRKIQCIGTSATLARGREDFPAVARFAEDIFGELFTSDDIIIGEKIKRSPPQETITLPTNIIFDWSSRFEKEGGITIQTMKDSLSMAGIPQYLVNQWETQANGSSEKFLFHILESDTHILDLQEYLANSETQEYRKIIKDLFPGTPHNEEMLHALISLAVRAKTADSEYPLIPARYHFFIRAIGGSFIAFCPEPIVTLDPCREILGDNGSYKVFEMAVCQNCGAVYLVGNINNNRLEHPHPIFYDYKPMEYYLLKTFPGMEYEEENSFDVDRKKGEPCKLCTRCGMIQKAMRYTGSCSCGSNQAIDVIRAIVDNEDHELHKCLSCGYVNSQRAVAIRFYTGSDAISSVLVTGLYEHIPPREIKIQNRLDSENDEWGYIIDDKERAVTKKMRKLLCFSDSRQDAAFFATYLSQTYHKVQQRALIRSLLEKYCEQIVKNQWTLKDFVDPIKNELRNLSICPDVKSHQEIENISWKWLLKEFYSFEERIGLGQLGLLWFVPMKPEGFSGIRYLQASPWNLSGEETWTLLAILLDTLRRQRIFQFPKSVQPDDEYFAPNNVAAYIRFDNSVKNPRIYSWLPPISFSNRRLDYIIRLAKRLDIDNFGSAEAREILEKLWNNVLKPYYPDTPFAKYFIANHLPGEGTAYQLAIHKWKADSHLLRDDFTWYECDVCHKITPHNIRGVCPTYKCSGNLHPIIPEKRFAENHYFRLYKELEPKKFRAEEHTAQLKKKFARELQADFIRGDVDVLCCSTTFELGVDVGELETVFLKNVPPTPANYIQRAGRAGRRTDTTAFCLTLCQMASHDYHHFLEPERMVKGKISPPSFTLENEKIVRRHLMALALSAFWRDPEYQSLFGTVENFFFQNNGPDSLRMFLRKKPSNLTKELESVVPQRLNYLLDDVNGEWRFVAEMFDPARGPLALATHEIRSDIEALKELYDKKAQKRERTDYIINIMNTLLNRRIIDYLASRNILPKYGFPVDVVELAIYSNEGKNLDLTRDMKIALSEYAPGSEVVAAKKLWPSRYVKRLIHKEMDVEQKDYVVCSNCKRYYTSIQGKLPVICEACEKPLESPKKLIFPEFGFIVDNKGSKKLSEKKPERVYSTRVFYTGMSEEKKTIPLPLPDGRTRLIATSAENGKFGILNNGKKDRGFKICNRCGYTIAGTERVPSTHETAFRQKCTGGIFETYTLGHEYMTDMVKLVFENYNLSIPEKEGNGFWHSLLYAILDGISDCLDIEREDIDGCIYYEKGRRTTLVLFDDVPGGAGHVKRLVEDENRLIQVLERSYQNLSKCSCGGPEGEASCYGCLKNYRNQFCHPELKRVPVIRFLEGCLGLSGEFSS